MSSAPSGCDEEKTIGLPAVPNGSMAIQQLSDWIEKATPDLQNSVVTDISCLYFFVSTMLGGSHELVLERAGKVIWSPLRLAIDRATFRAPGADKSFYKTHKLKFALLTDRSIAPEDSHFFDGFADFLDHKWRGPPLRLRDIAVYVSTIHAQETRYSLTSANCYWFARMLFHTVALRHYSFPTVASSILPRKYVLPTNDTEEVTDGDWRYHDPSSTGLVFRFLKYEAKSNGYLMVHRAVTIALFLLWFMLAAGAVYAEYRFFAAKVSLPLEAKVIAGIGLVGLLLFFLVLFSRQLMWALRLSITRRQTQRRVHGKTERVLSLFDQGCNPKGIRGPYTPARIPYVRDTYNPHTQQTTLPFAYRIHIYPVDRILPEPWEHEEQMYLERREEYLNSLEQMRRIYPQTHQRIGDPSPGLTAFRMSFGEL